MSDQFPSFPPVPTALANDGSVRTNSSSGGGDATAANQVLQTAQLTNLNATAQRSWSITRSSTTGTIAAGAKRLDIGNSGSSDITVKGSIIKPSESFLVVAPDKDTLEGFAYTATGSEIIIVEVR